MTEIIRTHKNEPSSVADTKMASSLSDAKTATPAQKELSSTAKYASLDDDEIDSDRLIVRFRISGQDFDIPMSRLRKMPQTLFLSSAEYALTSKQFDKDGKTLLVTFSRD